MRQQGVHATIDVGQLVEDSRAVAATAVTAEPADAIGKVSREAFVVLRFRCGSFRRLPGLLPAGGQTVAQWHVPLLGRTRTPMGNWSEVASAATILGATATALLP
jgi:hypothetical protein